jgi:hypothetical protein
VPLWSTITYKCPEGWRFRGDIISLPFKRVTCEGDGKFVDLDFWPECYDLEALETTTGSLDGGGSVENITSGGGGGGGGGNGSKCNHGPLKLRTKHGGDNSRSL